MQKRTIKIGEYDTSAIGGWVLAEWNLSPAVHHTNYVKVPGRNGAMDFSTILTDGEPTYDSRTLTATLDCSYGSRLERENAITRMINGLDGYVKEITLPDDVSRYIKGRVSVKRVYNDLVRARVSVSAYCEPWRYSKEDVAVNLTATSEEKTAEITNEGKKIVSPTVEVSGNVQLVFGSASWNLSTGTYNLTDFVLNHGVHKIRYSGSGKLTISYKEAII